METYYFKLIQNGDSGETVNEQIISTQADTEQLALIKLVRTQFDLVGSYGTIQLLGRNDK